MARRSEDRYTNLATTSVTESAAGTLTYAELATGISLGQGIGMLIDQIDYYVNASVIEDIVGAGDSVVMGWATSNAPPSIAATDRRFLHIAQLIVEPPIGTPASAGRPIQMPLVYQFFPAMIVAAPRLFLGIQGSSLNAAAIMTSRMYFRYIELSDKEYLELAEAFILVG